MRLRFDSLRCKFAATFSRLIRPRRMLMRHPATNLTSARVQSWYAERRGELPPKVC